MSIRSAWGAAAAVLVVLLGAAALVLKPVDAAGYREAVAQAAQEGLSAVRTVAHAVRADQSGKVTGAYLSVVVKQAREEAASAQRELATQEVPDQSARAVRDRAVPLLAAAVTAVSDAALAVDGGDRATVQAAVDKLDDVGDGLDSVVRSLR